MLRNLFGLYMSRRLINGCPQESADAPWQALTGRGITPAKNALAMTGPAAADYILSSAPGLL